MASAATTRTKGQPDPPAGYGMVAVIDDLTEVHTMAGNITLNTPGVGTITKYLAELVAVLHALSWATHSPEARDRPVCIRITGDYGVNIASGYPARGVRASTRPWRRRHSGYGKHCTGAAPGRCGYGTRP